MGNLASRGALATRRFARADARRLVARFFATVLLETTALRFDFASRDAAAFFREDDLLSEDFLAGDFLAADFFSDVLVAVFPDSDRFCAASATTPAPRLTTANTTIATEANNFFIDSPVQLGNKRASSRRVKPVKSRPFASACVASLCAGTIRAFFQHHRIHHAANNRTTHRR